MPKHVRVYPALDPGPLCDVRDHLADVSRVQGLTGAKLRDLGGRLEALRTHLPAPLQSLQYSVAFNPSQATVDAMRQTVLPQMLDDSRNLAQSLAAASGVKLGAIRSIGDSAGVSAGYVNGTFAVSLLGPVTGGILASLPSGTQYTYSLSVIFATVP